MTNELRTILVSLHGPDRPGVLAGLMHLLSAQDCEVYDVGQVVIRGRLMLNVLIGVPAEKATVRDLLYFAWEHDLEVDFEVVEPTPTPAKDLSVVTVIGLSYGNLLSGPGLPESIFSWPGIVRYMFRAFTSQDFPAIMGVSFLIALIYVVVNFVVDLLYYFLDPRIRAA